MNTQPTKCLPNPTHPHIILSLPQPINSLTNMRVVDAPWNRWNSSLYKPPNRHLGARFVVVVADPSDQTAVDELEGLKPFALTAQRKVRKQRNVLGHHPSLAVGAVVHADMVLDLVGSDRDCGDLERVGQKWSGKTGGR